MNARTRYTVTEAELDALEPIADEHGTTLRDDVPAGTPAENVWTVLEGENDYLYAAAGLHTVNRIGYLVTRLPWPDADTVAVYVNGNELERQDDDA